MQSSPLYVLRSSSRANVLGTGSIAFGFRRSTDAMHIVRKMYDIGPMAEVWYTKISPEKFVLTKSPRKREEPIALFVIEEMEEDEFVIEMITQNLSVRIIDGIHEEFNLTTLYSEMGYEPLYSSENAMRYLEDQFMK